MTPSGRSRTAASLAQVWMLQDQTSLQLVATTGGANINSQQSVEQSWNQLVQTDKDAMSLSGSGTPSELCHPAFGSARWTGTTNAALLVADFVPLTGNRARTHRGLACHNLLTEPSLTHALSLMTYLLLLLVFIISPLVLISTIIIITITTSIIPRR